LITIIPYAIVNRSAWSARVQSIMRRIALWAAEWFKDWADGGKISISNNLVLFEMCSF
jgi:hypothetical protein